VSMIERIVINAGSYIWIREITMTILVGCSGWSYDDWVGKFYPLNLAGKKGEWFSLLCRLLPDGRDQQHILPASGRAAGLVLDKEGQRFEGLRVLRKSASARHAQSTRERGCRASDLLGRLFRKDMRQAAGRSRPSGRRLATALPLLQELAGW
jgi:hypothetical protein